MSETAGVGPSRPTGDPIEGLLVELCTGLGYCAALSGVDREAAAAMSVDDLTDAVLVAEGLDPALTSRGQRSGLRGVVARWI